MWTPRTFLAGLKSPLVHRLQRVNRGYQCPKMSTNDEKKAVGYVRVSAESQEKNSSIEVQTAAIVEHCAASGIAPLRIFQDTGSGADLDDRPQYKAMIKFIKARKDIHAVVALRLDRVGRSALEILKLLDTLKARSCGLQIVEMPIDPHTPVGRLIFTIMAAVAELERYLILNRTASGRRAKEEAGGYAYGAPGFGWLARAGEMMPDLVEQEIIQYIRRWNRAGWSLRDMAKKLTALRLPTKRGGAWHPSIVSKIIKRFSK